MNPEELEKQLARQPLREPPAAWREEILAAANAKIRPAATRTDSELRTGWRALLARIPMAWGAVAALWLFIVGVNSWMSGPAATTLAKSSAPAPRDAMTVWNLHRAELSLLANGPGDFPEVTPRRETPAAPPRPRSDRRRDEGLGRFERDNVLERLV